MLLISEHAKERALSPLWWKEAVGHPAWEGTLRCLALRMDPWSFAVTANAAGMEENSPLVSYRLAAQAFSAETYLERKRVIRAMMYVRETMQRDIPDVFSGTVEVDETYLGGKWKNNRLSEGKTGGKRGRGTKKTPAFGILCRGGKVWAQIVPDVEAKTLLPLISKQVEPGSTVCSDTWKSYTGVAANGYVHRLVKHQEREYSVIAKETTSTGWKGSGATSNAGSLPKAVSVKKGFTFTWLNMCGVITIVTRALRCRRNNYLNYLKESTFSGSFGTLPI